MTAIGSQKLSCLCLLDLSAAFDTIDHDNLLTRLSSWFGSYGPVLNWFTSYLLSRALCVKCNDCLSSLHTSLYGVPKGSVHNTTFSLLSSLRLSGKHHSPTECSHTENVLDYFESLITQLLQNRVSSNHRWTAVHQC